VHAREPIAAPPILSGRGRAHFGDRLLCLKARLLAPGLDARVAAGEAASADKLLAIRSRQLSSQRQRRRLAAAVERLDLRPSRRPGISAAIPLEPRALHVGRPALAQLAQALRRPDAVHAQGVALTKLLLTEPASPLYRPRHSAAVYEAAREALLALARPAL
jgi:hypothetical protein